MKTDSLFVTNRIIDNGQYLIYYAHMLHSIFRIDKTTGKIELEGYLPTKDYFRSFLFDGNRYILFPEGAGRIGFINSRSDRVHYMNVPSGIHIGGEDNWSSNYIRYEDDVFFYWKSPVITKYNIVNQEWKAYRNWRVELPDDFFAEHWMSEEAFLHDGMLYFPVGSSKYLVEVNPVSGGTHICMLKIPVNVDEVQLVRYEKGVLWILCRNKENKMSILRSSSFLTESFEEITQICVESGKGKPFSLIAVGKRCLWLFPGNYDRSCVVNLRNGQAETSDVIPVASMQALKTKDIPYNYIYGINNSHTFWTMNIHTGELVKINLLQDEIHNIRMFASRQMYTDLVSGIFTSGLPITEGPIELTEFLNLIKGGKKELDERNDTVPDIFFRRDIGGNGNNGSVGDKQEWSNQKRASQKFYLPECYEEMEDGRDTRKWNSLFL